MISSTKASRTKIGPRRPRYMLTIIITPIHLYFPPDQKEREKGLSWDPLTPTIMTKKEGKPITNFR